MYGNNEDDGNPKKYITCPHCGEQILMVPVLSDMIQAIENHLETHKEGSYPKHDPIQRPRTPSLNENLAEQVLMRAAEIGDTLSKEPAISIHSLDNAK
jgi:DNA-directed RNA polymerase subunit RPC12/RpoP